MQVYVTLQLEAGQKGGEAAVEALRPMRPWVDGDETLVHIVRLALQGHTSVDNNFVTFDRSLATSGVLPVLSCPQKALFQAHDCRVSCSSALCDAARSDMCDGIETCHSVQVPLSTMQHTLFDAAITSYMLGTWCGSCAAAKHKGIAVQSGQACVHSCIYVIDNSACNTAAGRHCHAKLGNRAV